MPDPSEYILSFDLHEVESQIEAVKRLYNQFGSDLHESVSTLVQDVQSLEESILNISSHLSTITASLDLMGASLKMHSSDTSQFFEDMARYSKSVFDNLKEVSGLDLKKIQLEGAPDVPKTARERLADLFPDYKLKVEGITGKRLDSIVEGILDKNPDLKDLQEFRKNFKKEVEAYGGKIVEEVGAFGKILSSEIKNAKSASQGLMSRALPGGIVGGGIIGGLIGLMLLGVTETDRLRHEAGEMKNVFEATGDDLFSSMGRKATKWFSSFAEKAQWHYGIGRKEIQGIVKSMVDSGFKFDEIMMGMSKRLGEVGKNVVTLSLGIDKHFNIGTGTSIKHIDSLVSQYGDTLKDAAKKYTNLGFAAQQSGIGVGKFIDSVMSGSSALTQYGIDMNDVAVTMEKLQKHYEGMGLGRQMAGGIAGQALAGLSRGIAGLDDPMIALLARRAGAPAGDAVEQIQWFKEGWKRVSEGKDLGFFNKIVQAMSGYVAEQITGGRAEQIMAAEKLFKLDNITATSLMDAKDELAKTGKISEGTNKQLKRLRDAFKTEGDQVSELRKSQRDLIDGLAKIGKGLLRMLSGVLGTLVMFVASIPKLVEAAAAFFTLDTDKAVQILSELKDGYAAQFETLGMGFGEAMEGAGALPGIFGEEMGSIFGKESSLKKAIDIASGNWGTLFSEAKKDISDLAESDALQMRMLADLNMSLYSLGMDIANIFGTKRQREEFASKVEAEKERRRKVWGFAQKRAYEGETLKRDPMGLTNIPGLGRQQKGVRITVSGQQQAAAAQAYNETTNQ